MRYKNKLPVDTRCRLNVNTTLHNVIRRRVSTGLKFSKSRCFLISPLRITDKNDKLSALLYYRYIDKIINNFLFGMSNYALKDMNMLNYGAINYTSSLYHSSTRCIVDVLSVPS